jgi:hypothetical protein
LHSGVLDRSAVVHCSDQDALHKMRRNENGNFTIRIRLIFVIGFL